MIPDWLGRADIAFLLDAAKAEAIELRFVGGAVRSWLRGETAADFDLATPIPPETVLEKLGNQGIKIVPTGLKHGTVTAVIDGKPFEITTLRRDVETDGRHAVIQFTKSWEEDAARRDFTMNALYLSPKGEIFDPVHGIEDAKEGYVRFIGDAEKRIREDGLRILRFFRFYAQLGGALDPEGLSACEKNLPGLEMLSGERISSEMFKLLRAKNPLPALQAMQQSGVLAAILPSFRTLDALTRVMEVEKTSGIKPCTKIRLGALLRTPKDAEFLKTRWKCSGEILEEIRFLWRDPPVDRLDSASIKRLVRRVGNRRAVKLLLWQWAKVGVQEKNYASAIAFAGQWQSPPFPVAGIDLLEMGMAEGKALGESLKRLEVLWEQSDYRLDKQELLTNLRKL